MSAMELAERLCAAIGLAFIIMAIICDTPLLEAPEMKLPLLWIGCSIFILNPIIRVIRAWKEGSK
ncbi:hypothetical protein LCGC14_0297940 [marine sediment metagenome]|uniref:Uncharacterized protein n=1 Tax=marine sediment metagenome TaxID=412755 RepID=A0A0F9TR64_9ZZZZ